MILFLIVFISYGQILGMYVWQDDNALFFKLANIEGPAGFLGVGPFGEGAYRYTATPYIPIYQIFGFNTFYYFLSTLIIYFISTFVVYKIFKNIFDKRSGMLAGFLYGCGYIASDGFIRLFNSIATSVSIILISLLLYFYWKFEKTSKNIYYFLSLIIFFLATDLVRARTHYLVSIVVVFELLFLTFKKRPVGFFYSILRLIPFLYIFYRYFVLGADERSNSVKNLIISILHGNISQSYSFFSSLANLIFPDWITTFLFNLQLTITNIIPGIPVILLISFIGILLIQYLIFRKNKRGILIILFFILISIFWAVFYNDIFRTSLLNLSPQQMYVVFFGGIGLVLLVSGLFAVSQKKLYVLFLTWIILNLGAYSAYSPTVAFESVNRYLSHSFFALIGFFTLVTFSVKNKKILYLIFIIWGLGNLLSAVFYQNTIVRNRSNPPREFYSRLLDFHPQAKKGEVFYFDVAGNARDYFKDAFSVAQMPETTALAWRYGIDRYDIKMFTQFNALSEAVSKDNISLNNIYTFFYSKDGLIDTTEQFRKLTNEVISTKDLIANFPYSSQVRTKSQSSEDILTQQDITINLDEPISSIFPQELILDIKATRIDSLNLKPPFVFETYSGNQIYKDPTLRKLAFEYKNYKQQILTFSKYTSSSEWKERTTDKLHDGDPETFWQADRVLWGRYGAQFVINLPIMEDLSGFAWINGYASNTPINYLIDTSEDGTTWQIGTLVSSKYRIETKDPQIIKFNPRKAKYIRMQVYKTLSGDSPEVSEAWPITSHTKNLDILQAENFFISPYSYIPDISAWNQINKLSNFGMAKIYWKGNGNDGWISSNKSVLNINFDGRRHKYSLIIPAGGTFLDTLNISEISVPGNLQVFSIKSRKINLK